MAKKGKSLDEILTKSTGMNAEQREAMRQKTYKMLDDAKDATPAEKDRIARQVILMMKGK